MLSDKKPKIIIIAGPTASGKTKLAVKLARRYNGEIVSADSRQVYRGMDIGTGKDLREYRVRQIANGKSRIVTVPYHLINIASPKAQFTVGGYQKLANKAIGEILKRGKVPIVCGGTGLYIAALVDNYQLPGLHVAKRELQSVRKKLEKVSLEQLLLDLQKIDPETFAVIDKKNRRRVSRALEIYYTGGVPKSQIIAKRESPYEFLLLGVKVDQAVLDKKIAKRLNERLNQGMIAEVKRLHRDGVSYKKLEAFGLEYKYIALYLRGKLTKAQMVEQLKNAIRQYSKRQMTWFRHDKRVVWVTGYSEAVKYVSSTTKV